MKPKKPDLEYRLEQLRREYDLSQAGLNAIFRFLVVTMFLSFGLLYLGVLFAHWDWGKFSQWQAVDMGLFIAAWALVSCWSAVFGRKARIRAEISRTKAMLDAELGDTTSGRPNENTVPTKDSATGN